MLLVALGIPAAICVVAAHLLSRPIRQVPRIREANRERVAAFEDVRLRSRKDRVEIAGWFLGPSENDRAIVMVHGKDSSRTMEFDRALDGRTPGEFTELAHALNARGFAVLMIDLRGHGESGAGRFGFGRGERRDVLGAVDWLGMTKGIAPGRIGLLGVSMGAASVLGAASEEGRIGALVADSSFAELASLVEANWATASGLPRAFLRPTLWFGRWIFGCDVARARPVDDVARVRCPVLIIHGEHDPITPSSHARALHSAAGPGAELWIAPSTRHAGVYLDDPSAYLDRVAGFLDRSIG